MSKIFQLIRDNAQRKKQPVNLVRNAAEASLYIYDVIDPYWGVSAQSVIDAIARAGDAEVLHVYINSPGGSVFEGRAIMAAIARFAGKTIAHIDSLCASAATGIALACNEVEMSEGAFFMIHNASGMAWGDKTELRETADLLEKVEGSIIGDYTAKTGVEAEQIVAWMDAETWFTAAESLEHGFIDRITTAPAAKASNAWNLSAYAKTPAALAAASEPAVPVIAQQVSAVLTPVEDAEPASKSEPAVELELVANSMTQSNRNRLALATAM